MSTQALHRAVCIQLLYGDCDGVPSFDTIQHSHVHTVESAQAKLKAAPGMEKKHPGVTAAGAGGGVPAATGWQKPAAKGAKKKGKGRKADATMLGFAAGLDYTAFERPET